MLLSALTYATLVGAWYFDSEPSPLSIVVRLVFKLSRSLEWLPYQLGRLIPALQIPNELASTCGFEPRSLMVAALGGGNGHFDGWSTIGNFYLNWRAFLQHMLASTIVYFLIFMVLSELRQWWLRKTEPAPTIT